MNESLSNPTGRSARMGRWITGAVALLFVITVSAFLPAGVAEAATPPAGFGAGSGFCSSVIPGGYTLGASFDGVYACGPANNKGTGYEVPASGSYKGYFEAASWSYQCVELANRFLFDQYGLTPIKGSTLVGGNYVATAHSRYPSVAVASSPGTVLPVAGDIISMWGGSSGQNQNGSVSHVAVVTGVTTTSSGWTITVMEQNASVGGSNTIKVSSNGSTWSYGNGYYAKFQWLKLRVSAGPPSNGASPSPAVVQRSNGETDVLAVGANGALYYYYNAQGSPNWNQLTVASSGIK
jgi:CHAP domain